MNVHEVDELPAGRTPRNLFKLSGEKFFNIIVVRALPALELYLAEDECYNPRYFPTRLHIMKYLKELKNHFELDTIPLLGPKDSPLRLSLENVFHNVLDDHCEVMEGPRDQQLVAIFMFQIFFLKKAGKITTTHLYGADHFSPRLQEFMRCMGASKVTVFYNDKIYFDIPENLAFFFQYLPCLQSIHLHTCYDECVLESIRKYCLCLEEFVLEINCCEHITDKENTLCGAFFCGLSMFQMLSELQYNKAKNLSFPRLRQVTFYSKTPDEGTIPYHIIFLLQHFYVNAKVKWYFCIGNEEKLDSIVESGILCPSFVKDYKDKLYFDVLAFSAEPIVFEDEEASILTPQTPMFLKANCIHFNDCREDLANIPLAIKELMRKHYCRKLQLSYTPYACWHLSEIFSEIGENLAELYLQGTCLRTLDGVQLSAALRQCINLRVLSLELDLKFSPLLEDLRTFTKLEVLSFKIADFFFWEFNSNENEVLEGRYSECVAAYMNLNFVNHNLPLYLHCNDLPPNLFHRYIHSAWESNGNRMPTLKEIPGFPVTRSLKKFSFWPMKSSIFGPGTLKYDIPSSRSRACGYGVVEWRDPEWEFDAVSCQYRSPRFVFHGNSKYGFQLSSSTLPEESHSFANIDTVRSNPFSKIDNNSNRDIEIVHGSSPYKKLYSHLQQRTKLTLSLNHKSQELENNLKQWRPDMDFSAPFNILSSLIKASPNLRMLEIPDLRITDPFTIFCNKDILQNLSKVHTLHVSAQFSTPLIYSFVNIDSLKTVRVDPEYGMDNYLRFKRGLSKTNLEVQFGHSFVYPSSKYLEKL